MWSLSVVLSLIFRIPITCASVNRLFRIVPPYHFRSLGGLTFSLDQHLGGGRSESDRCCASRVSVRAYRVLTIEPLTWNSPARAKSQALWCRAINCRISDRACSASVRFRSSSQCRDSRAAGQRARRLGRSGKPRPYFDRWQNVSSGGQALSLASGVFGALGVGLLVPGVVLTKQR